MVAIENEINQQVVEKDKSFKFIPRFFFPKGGPNDNIQKAFSDAVKNQYKTYCQSKLFSSDELDKVWELLLEKDKTQEEGNEKISFAGYKEVRNQFPEFKSKEYFDQTLFLRLPKDDLGRISIPVLFNHILRKAALVQNRIALLKHDLDNDGFLTEKDLERYVDSSIDSITGLHTNTILKTDKSFRKIYVETSVRKFLFFHANNNGKICIEEFVGSKEMVEFNELQNDDLSQE